MSVVRKFFAGRTVGEEQWLTPRYITDALGPFDLDPCSPIKRPWDTAQRHLTKIDDGLKDDWSAQDFMWVNPPYGSECSRWLARAADQGNCIALIFARTDTKMFHQSIFRHPNVTAICFIEGRLRFCTVDGSPAGSAGSPSVLVTYGVKGRDRLMDAVGKGEVKGRVVLLSNASENVT